MEGPEVILYISFALVVLLFVLMVGIYVYLWMDYMADEKNFSLQQELRTQHEASMEKLQYEIDEHTVQIARLLALINIVYDRMSLRYTMDELHDYADGESIAIAHPPSPVMTDRYSVG